MTTLPRPTKETYIDFLRRKLKGRNISPEFMARNPAYFDLRGEDAPPTQATWETFYRRAKPKTSVDSGTVEGLFYPDPPVTNAPSDLARGIKRGWNEFTTGFPDLRSQDSIEAQQSALIDGKTAYDTPGYRNTGMSLQQELMPTNLWSGLYESELNPSPSPEELGDFSELSKFNPNVDVRGEAGILNYIDEMIQNQVNPDGSVSLGRQAYNYDGLKQVEKWGPLSYAAQQQINEDKE